MDIGIPLSVGEGGLFSEKNRLFTKPRTLRQSHFAFDNGRGHLRNGFQLPYYLIDGALANNLSSFFFTFF
jgi:hypothetical protein